MFYFVFVSTLARAAKMNVLYIFSYTILIRELTGLKYVMPIFFSIGMAMSDLQVVGLQDPPRNTSHGGGGASLPAQHHTSETVKSITTKGTGK